MRVRWGIGQRQRVDLTRVLEVGIDQAVDLVGRYLERVDHGSCICAREGETRGAGDGEFEHNLR